MDRSKNSRVTPLFFFFLSFLAASPVAAESDPTHSGIFMGYLVDVRPDYSSVTVKPIDKAERRRRFYLDKKTTVSVDGKRSKKEEIYYGDKVAVRYFGKGGNLVADAIFVEFGEFEPKNYIKKKKIVVVPKAEKEPAKKAH